MPKGTSMWLTSRSRAPRLQLRRPVPMCMSCPSLRSPCPWLSSRVARVSESVSLKVCTAGDAGTWGMCSGKPRPPWLYLRLGCVTRGYGPSSGPGAGCLMSVIPPPKGLPCRRAVTGAGGQHFGSRIISLSLLFPGCLTPDFWSLIHNLVGT